MRIKPKHNPSNRCSLPATSTYSNLSPDILVLFSGQQKILSNMITYFVLCASRNIICPTTSGKIQFNLFLCKYRSHIFHNSMFDKNFIDSLQITKENDIECYVRSGLYKSVYTWISINLRKFNQLCQKRVKAGTYIHESSCFTLFCLSLV